jgi:hypothetical protein
MIAEGLVRIQDGPDQITGRLGPLLFPAAELFVSRKGRTRRTHMMLDGRAASRCRLGIEYTALADRVLYSTDVATP